MENQFERVEEDSPLRCQATTSRGQCINKQVEGSNYCMAHGGNRGLAKLKKEKQRMYAIERFQSKLNSMEDHSGLKSLSAEIAVLRMMLETRLRRCNDDHELMLHSHSISNLVASIDKLVNSTHRLDMQLKNYLDANAAMQFIQSIVEILGNYIPDDLEQVSDEILAAYVQIKEGNNG